ncbi:hypothetical protein [Conyzicola nivalis]|nr:hypothetical protein [Conyzicola nivalis]
MTTPYDIVHQVKMQRHAADQNETLVDMLGLLKYQTEAARRSQRSA